MSALYWWSCYGRFTPGEGILPHMGEVIAEYRQRRGLKTQAELAIAAGVLPRSVTDWESKAMLRDSQRRVFLAKLLKIPPALLGLDWRTVVYEDNTGNHSHQLAAGDEVWLEDSYYHYEDSLVMAYDLAYSGRFSQVADRFERRLRKLDNIARNVSGLDREAWMGLLCQYYYASINTPQSIGNPELAKAIALQRCETGILIATELDDKELLASGLFRKADIYENNGEYQLARDCIEGALQYIEQVHNPAKGNIYLRAADMTSRFIADDPGLITQIRNWQDKAANILYKGHLDPDRSFLRLNHAALHHERAKTLLRFYQMQPNQKKLLRDAQDEIKLAWDALTPDITAWQTYFFITEARLYISEHDIEGSARLTLDALRSAREIQSNKGEKQVQKLFLDLRHQDNSNPYVCNLGVELRMF